MLTTLLLLATTTLAAQDAAPGAVPPAAPPQDAPATPAAPAAPKETAPEVRAFLGTAEKLLYDPEASGLKSLAFDVPVIVPQLGGQVGLEHVQWTTGSEPVFSFKQDEGSSLPPGVPPEALEQVGGQFGQQLLDCMLNRPITSQLKDSVATMGTPEGGMVKIDLYSADAEAQGIKERSFFFDEDAVLQKFRTKLEMEIAQGMPKTSITVVESYSWKPAGDSKLLLQDKVSSEAEVPVMGPQKATKTFVQKSVGNVWLSVEMRMAANGQSADKAQVLTAKNLVVNGTAVPAEPEVPAETPSETPPAPTSGG